MGETSAIEWTEATWNPVIGCHKVSPGCAQCYAEWTVEKRMGRDFSVPVRASPTTFNAPLRWKEPKLVFTCSLSDFFLEEADAYRGEMWDVIRRTPQHTYQVLTKRPERILEHLPRDWGNGWSNVWIGTSVELQVLASRRVPVLLDVPAYVRFLSCEPLLGPLDLRKWLVTGPRDQQDGIHWVITGGESARSPQMPRLDAALPAWFRQIRDACITREVAYFHKQNGGTSRCACHGAWGCRLLDGRTWDQIPPKWRATLKARDATTQLLLEA